MSEVGFVGLGKLGLPVSLAIESKGHEVIGYDINPDVKTYIEQGAIPYREEGLQPLLDETRLEVVSSIADVVGRSELIFVPIQTPHEPEYEGATRIPADRKDFDYEYLETALQEIDAQCAIQGLRRTVAVISTCLPGTYEDRLKQYTEHMDYVYTPQFIAMGNVLGDYLNPEFNLLGVESNEAADKLEAFYSTINDAPNVRTDITTAEGIKVSYNTWITAKTVIANAWGELAEKTGMDFDDIKKAWDLSTKRLLSSRYMDAGMSDGGGCHPRDNIALSYIADKVGMSHNIWEDLMEAREDYEEWHADVTLEHARANALPIVVLGRAFKPETDIETGSPSILMANILREKTEEVTHVNDCVPFKACYFIGVADEKYSRYTFPAGSVVVDPHGIVPDRDGVEVVRLGRS